jgi:hypothetical protein
MARFLRLSDEDVERMFRGLAPERDEDLHDLATFLVDASERLSRPPRSEVEARHLAMLAEAIASRPASESTERRGPVRPRTVRWAAKVAVTAVGIVFLTAALAFAGVDLPGTAAETAFSSVGLDLPNQNQAAADAVDPAKLPADASDTAVRVLTVIHDWFSGAEWNGCEFGARLSQAARGLEGEPDTSHCDAGGAEGSHAQGAGASANSEKGRETAEEASGGAASHAAAAVPDEASSAGGDEADGAAAGS